VRESRGKREEGRREKNGGCGEKEEGRRAVEEPRTLRRPVDRWRGVRFAAIIDAIPHRR
jgi:hypothetical protein